MPPVSSKGSGEEGMINIDQKTEIRELLAHVAGNDYEGWEGYYTDREKWAKVIEAQLELWQEYAHQKV